jgi:hypothetical protein
MKPRQPLSLSTRKKLTEELYQRYIAWGDEALRDGNPTWSTHYYRLAERCLHLIHSPHLEVMHAIATSPPLKEGISISKNPAFKLLMEESSSCPSIAIMNFEEPSATYGNYPTQEFGEGK